MMFHQSSMMFIKSAFHVMVSRLWRTHIHLIIYHNYSFDQTRWIIRISITIINNLMMSLILIYQLKEAKKHHFHLILWLQFVNTALFYMYFYYVCFFCPGILLYWIISTLLYWYFSKICSQLCQRFLQLTGKS